MAGALPVAKKWLEAKGEDVLARALQGGPLDLSEAAECEMICMLVHDLAVAEHQLKIAKWTLGNTIVAYPLRMMMREGVHWDDIWPVLEERMKRAGG